MPNSKSTSSEPTPTPSSRAARASPGTLQLIREYVPTELLGLSRWVAWDGRRLENGKLDKTPINPTTGGNAMSNNSSTWGTFEQACQLALRDERVGGLGLVLTDSDFWALDLDHVIDRATGEVAPAARAFRASITHTYVERSPSGDGLHVIYRGQRPAQLRQTRGNDAFGTGKNLEVFGGASARYLTMTGQVWDADTASICEASQDTIDTVLAMFPAEVNTTSSRPLLPTTLDEEERKARRALQNVPADDYDIWIFIGMALASAFPEAVAKSLWIEWSKKSSKYDDNAIDPHWGSFRDRSSGKTIAYVYWLAKQNEPGWWQRWREEEERRPRASVSSVSPSAGPGPEHEVAARADEDPSVSSVSASSGGGPSFRPLRPLPDLLLPVPAFNPALLPTVLGGWVEDIADRIQCPTDFPAVAAVVTYSAVVGRRIGIRPKQQDNWLVVPNLWGGVVGRPGVMKTPGMQEPVCVLGDLEREAKAHHERELQEHEAQRMVAKARERVVEKEIKADLVSGGDGLDIARNAVAQEPTVPVRRRYKTNDSTVEKLGEILNENPNGVLVFRDELTGFLKVLDKEGNEGARAFYLESWNGTGDFAFDRIGRGTIDIEAAITSVLGGIQPGPLSGYLRSASRAGVDDDGLVQRFQLLVYPDVSRDWKNVDRRPNAEARARAVAAYRAAARLDAASLGAERDGPDGIPYLRFDAEAQDAFDAWREPLEKKVRSGTDDPAIEAHLSKYRSLVPSLALLFHVADGCTGPVRLESLQRSIAWAKYLEAHARRIYGLCVGGHQECLAIAEHILNGDLCNGFDTRSVYRPCWTFLPDAQAADKGLHELVQLGWLAEELVPTSGRTGTVYRINPKLWESHPRPTDRTDRGSFDPSRNDKSPTEATDRADRSPNGSRREGDEWSTPPEILAAVRAVLGEIDTDPATNVAAQQRIRAKVSFTKADNGLLHFWYGRLFCNPPFSYPLIELFVLKTVAEYRAGRVTEGILLTNSQTSAEWFHVAAREATAICTCRGRIRFLRPNGERGPNPAHGQTIFYFGPNPARFAEVFSAFGSVTITRRESAA